MRYSSLIMNNLRYSLVVTFLQPSLWYVKLLKIYIRVITKIYSFHHCKCIQYRFKYYHTNWYNDRQFGGISYFVGAPRVMLSFLDNELQLPLHFLQMSVAAFGHLVNLSWTSQSILPDFKQCKSYFRNSATRSFS